MPDPTREPTRRPSNALVEEPGPVAWWALVGAGFALVAVALEFVTGQFANSPVPGLAEVLAPLTWPRPLRTAWWLAVALGVGSFHLGRYRAGHAVNRPVALLTTTAFVAFALGVAFDAEWTAFH